MVILSRTGVAVRERWQLEYGVAVEGKECLNQLLEMEELEKCLSLSRRTAEVSTEKWKDKNIWLEHFLVPFPSPNNNSPGNLKPFVK